ncbi:hypothetical protein, variant [Sphaeroforma arctica JP610]|nr:hypothetical protein, variant [Sphaeroforma arctica JP610]KNC85577.1 hypothetical protein, variant [Sphaeroforma arctica JP610]|eukprot:XP_014159479.1 hypothetical protein, variant [Sphaeroforma arctica JP610]
MRRVVDPNYVKRVREVEVVPEKGAGSVYKSSNKVGKVKRRWRPRGEREMLWEMDLEQKSETTRFNGHREKLEQHYMLFVNDGKGNFEVIPTDNWYKFTQEVKYETMSLEEVEAEMKKKKSGDRWVQTRLKAREEKQEEQKAALSTAMSGQTGAQSDSEEEDAINDPLDIVTKHDKKMAKKAAGKRKVEREDMEYEAEFTDDEAGAVTQEALEETEEYEAPPESDSDDEDGEPAEDELTKTGKELRKKLKDGVDDADLPATNADDNADDSDDELGVVIKPTTSKPPPQTQPQPQVRKAPAAPRVKREAAPKAQKRPREEIDDSAKNIPMKRLKPESISPFTEEEVCKLIMSMENASIKDILAKDKKIKRTIGRDKAEKQRFIDIMNKVTKKNETGQTKTYTLKPKFKELYNL